MAPTGEPESCSKMFVIMTNIFEKVSLFSITNVFPPFCSSIVRQKRHKTRIPIKNARQQRRGTFNVYVCNKHSPFAELAVVHCLMPISNSDTRLLPWQFLYMACTRAQKTLFFFAQKGDIGYQSGNWDHQSPGHSTSGTSSKSMKKTADLSFFRGSSAVKFWSEIMILGQNRLGILRVPP